MDIPGAIYKPFDDNTDRYSLIATQTYTPASSASKINITCHITTDASDVGDGYHVIPFIILDNDTVNFNNIKNDFLASRQLINDATHEADFIVKYNYTISSSSLKTIKLYIATQLEFGVTIYLKGYHMEVLEIY